MNRDNDAARVLKIIAGGPSFALQSVRQALEDAARSLETIAELAGREETLMEPDQVRGYAASRAHMARAALATQRPSQFPGETLADRLDAMADAQPSGSQASSDLYAAATVWRKHLKGPQHPSQSEAHGNLLARATDLHEKASMPWADAEELALKEAGIDDAAIDELIGECAPCGLESLVTGADELRRFTRAVIVHQPAALAKAQGASQ